MGERIVTFHVLYSNSNIIRYTVHFASRFSAAIGRWAAKNIQSLLAHRHEHHFIRPTFLWFGGVDGTSDSDDRADPGYAPPGAREITRLSPSYCISGDGFRLSFSMF